MQDEPSAEVAKIGPERKFHKHPSARHVCGSNAVATESEDCTESSEEDEDDEEDEEEEDEEEEENPNIKMNNERLMAQKMEHPVGSRRKLGVQKGSQVIEAEKKLNKNSDLEVCGHCQVQCLNHTVIVNEKHFFFSCNF